MTEQKWREAVRICGRIPSDRAAFEKKPIILSVGITAPCRRGPSRDPGQGACTMFLG